MLWLLRGCFGAIIIGLALSALEHFNQPPATDWQPGILAFIIILGVGFFVMAADMFWSATSRSPRSPLSISGC